LTWIAGDAANKGSSVMTYHLAGAERISIC
jgi:hypothetical protein